MGQLYAIIQFDRNKPKDDPIREIFEELEPETEVQLETEDKTFYEAKFQEFDTENEEAKLLVDQFYVDGGEEVNIPVSMVVKVKGPDVQEDDSEDEVE
ncbi:hypothetical protein [Bacillus solimangrovi]|uniref:Uncharacterized protein n=1 Tax=Bacillus solimangrovi TaxID=1305675 RepID=A0A1E5LG41_9BACI|nr:hypothetical protein [Bacillus solimangrovi]OEH93040.1 hypothetical protein BFG57_13875 [Bacillus solimangrovi]